MPGASGWGTQRRLRALANRSWSPEAIAQATGIPAAELAAAVDNRAAASPQLHQRVAAAYDQLWDKPPPLATPRDRELARQARAHAEHHRWPPPLAYDDDLIDLPDGHPAPGWRRSERTTHRTRDLAEDIAWVREHGGYRHAPIRVIAMRLGVGFDALEQAHCRSQRAARHAQAEAEAS
jgi:hypothetical protein